MSSLGLTLWRADELASVLGGEVCGPVGNVTSVSIDTRTLEEDALFFAIKGDVRDGHEFVQAALEKGAAAAVVDRAHADSFGGDARLIVVDDVLASLERMAKHRRDEMTGRWWLSPALWARPPPRRCCARSMPGKARPMLPLLPTTTIGACR